ncbi:MAG: hypothetical protein NZ521_12340 [Flammeovirgaceae bacterium]|nr:hypothetical protein [Flammeovirgaceae bacterium]MDW8289027.1 hypothetical protein [Flammeovirgaceae bacterium]
MREKILRQLRSFSHASKGSENEEGILIEYCLLAFMKRNGNRIGKGRLGIPDEHIKAYQGVRLLPFFSEPVRVQPAINALPHQLFLCSVESPVYYMSRPYTSNLVIRTMKVKHLFKKYSFFCNMFVNEHIDTKTTLKISRLSFGIYFDLQDADN